MSQRVVEEGVWRHEVKFTNEMQHAVCCKHTMANYGYQYGGGRKEWREERKVDVDGSLSLSLSLKPLFLESQTSFLQPSTLNDE